MIYFQLFSFISSEKSYIFTFFSIISHLIIFINTSLYDVLICYLKNNHTIDSIETCIYIDIGFIFRFSFIYMWLIYESNCTQKYSNYQNMISSPLIGQKCFGQHFIFWVHAKQKSSHPHPRNTKCSSFLQILQLFIICFIIPIRYSFFIILQLSTTQPPPTPSSALFDLFAVVFGLALLLFQSGFGLECMNSQSQPLLQPLLELKNIQIGLSLLFLLDILLVIIYELSLCQYYESKLIYNNKTQNTSYIQSNSPLCNHNVLFYLTLGISIITSFQPQNRQFKYLLSILNHFIWRWIFYLFLVYKLVIQYSCIHFNILSMEAARQYRQKQLAITYQEYVQRGRTMQNLIIERYVIYNKIGQGAHGEVYRGMDDQSKKQVAIKLMNLREIYNERNSAVKSIKLRLAESQPKLMYMCDSDHLIKCYEVYSNQDLKLLILQYCNGATLQSEIDLKKRIPENQAITIIKHIINGLMELHKHNIIHRDLKAENIMSHNGKYKIIDFGFSKKLQISQENAEIKGTSLGTITTMAPEVMSKKPYGLKADIWSLGIIFFQMIYGQYPYDSLTAPTLYQEIRSKKIFDSEEPLQFNGYRPSKQAFDFIKFLIVFDTEQRPNWKKVVDHPLINKNCDNISQRFIYQVEVALDPELVNKQIIKTQKEHDEKSIVNAKKQSQIQKQKLKEKEKSSSLSSGSVKSQQKQKSITVTIKQQKSINESKLKLSRQDQQFKNEQKKIVSKGKFNIMETLKLDKLKEQARLKELQEQKIKKNNQENMIKQLKDKQIKQKEQREMKERQQREKIQAQQRKRMETPNGMHRISKENQKKLQALMRQQNQRTEFTHKSHLECLKSELIFQQIILELQKEKELDLESRQNIQFLYLLIARCFNNMSHLKNELYTNKELKKSIDNLLNQITPLYNRVNSKFIEYSQLLTKFQSKYKQVFKDLFWKAFKKDKFQEKDKFLTGIEVVNYTKTQQIKYTEQYYKEIRQNFQKSVKNEKVLKLLDNYGKIISVKRQDLQSSNKKTFEAYAKSFL